MTFGKGADVIDISFSEANLERWRFLVGAGKWSARGVIATW